jgi:molecular chaperone GrpE
MQENTPNPQAEPELTVDESTIGTPTDPVSDEQQAQAADGKTDSVPGLEHQLREAELKAAELHDAWLRAKAETENVRRRSAEEVIKAGKFAIEKFAAELLSVKDGLEQTLAVEAPSLETIREGVELTLRNLARAFEKGNVAEVNPVGEKFDPNQHQAMSMVPSDQPANTVVQVFQKGYLLEGRVIRPALVAVSSGSGS